MNWILVVVILIVIGGLTIRTLRRQREEDGLVISSSNEVSLEQRKRFEDLVVLLFGPEHFAALADYPDTNDDDTLADDEPDDPTACGILNGRRYSREEVLQLINEAGFHFLFRDVALKRLDKVYPVP